VELNDWLAKRCLANWQELKHPEYTEPTIAETLEIEREHLMLMPETFDGYVEKTSGVSSTCLVAVARNRYSVPCEWEGKLVSTRLYPTQVVVVGGDEIVARHDRLGSRGQTAYDWQHYIDLIDRKPGALRNGAPFLDMPEVLQRLRTALMRQPDGDRTMADVLTCVPQSGLDAVLVAISLALEDVTPSGQVSVENVKHILVRLNSPRIPDPVVTELKLKEAPWQTRHAMTDCARLKTTVRRCIMRPDIRDSLKSLRLNGMVMAWEELTENGGSNRIENSKWLLEHLIEAEDTNRAMRSIVHQMKAAKFPLRRDLAGFAKRF
jgi:hypothetical protein